MPEASGGPDALQARLAALEQRVAELAGAEEASRALSEIGRDLAATLDPDETTRHIVDVVVRFFRTPAANLYRLDEGGLTLTWHCHRRAAWRRPLAGPPVLGGARQRRPRGPLGPGRVLARSRAGSNADRPGVAGRTPGDRRAAAPGRGGGLPDPAVRPTRLFAALARGLQAAPAREEPVVTATPGTRSDAVTPCRPLRILVAEDNRVNQVVIVRMLEKAGHRVSLAANGREAVDAVAREAYDLVMMDCQMPELDGFEAPVTADRLVAALARWGAASG